MPIIGECPYCNKGHMIALPDEFESLIEIQLPIFQRTISDCCNKSIWIKYSRVNPEVLTEEKFLTKYNVNKETKEVFEKP